MTDKSDASMIALLSSLRASGQLDSLLEAMHTELGGFDSEFDMISEPGSMSDASKRRGDDLSHAEAAHTKQRPLPMSGSAETSTVKDEFPPGIDSLEMWGCTVLETGKFAKESLTYHELSSSSDADKKRYCSWLLSQKSRKDFSPEMRDFVKYLNLVSHDDSQQSYFPGSTVVRKLRHG